MPVEIQIRTEAQDLWAQIFERLGDAWGRAIRYGGPPDQVESSSKANAERAEILALMAQLSSDLGKYEAEIEQFSEWPPDFDNWSVDSGAADQEQLRDGAMRLAEVLADYNENTKRLLDTIGRVLDQEGD